MTVNPAELAALAGQLRAEIPVAGGTEFEEAALQGSEACLTVRSAGDRLVLVLVSRSANLALVHRKARAVAGELAAADNGSERIVGAA